MAGKASSIIGDAINQLSRATLVIAEVEENARKEVARIAKEAEAYRRERDVVKDQLQTAQSETEVCKHEIETLKLRSVQMESEIKHRDELIESIRRESQRWKEKCSRVDEARVRQEQSLLRQIQDWREQYQRAEDERMQLIAKLEAAHPPFSLHHQVSNTASPSPTTTKVDSNTRAREYSYHDHHDLSPTAVEDDYYERPRKRAQRLVSPDHRRQSRARPDFSESASARSQTRRKRDSEYEDDDSGTNTPPKTVRRATPVARARKSLRTSEIREQYTSDGYTASGDVRAGKRQELIRRVQAIVSVPIKQEDDDETDGIYGVESAGLYDSGMSASASTSGSVPASRSLTQKQSTSSSTKTKSGRLVKPVPARPWGGRKRPYVEVDDEGADLADPYDDEERDRDYHDESQSRGRKSGRQRPSGGKLRKSQIVDDESEDDELRIGAEENQQEVYGFHRPIKLTSVPQVKPSGTKRKASSEGGGRGRPSITSKAKR